MKLILILIACFTLCGCASSSSAPRAWQTSELIGYRLRLVSAVGAIQEFRFTEAGDVMATLGSSEAVACPAFSWAIKDDGSLRIFDFEQRTFATLRILQTSGSKYIVDENGVVLEFVRDKWADYYGWHPRVK